MNGVDFGKVSRAHLGRPLTPNEKGNWRAAQRLAKLKSCTGASG